MVIKSYSVGDFQFYEVYVSAYMKGKKKELRRKGINRLKDAQRIEFDLLQQCRERLEFEVKYNLNWKQTCLDYLRSKRDDKLEPVEMATLLDYQSIIKKWTRPIYFKKLQDIEEKDIVAILNEMALQGLSHVSKNKVKNMVNRIFRWAVLNQILPPSYISPAHYIRLREKKERVPLVHTIDESKKLLQEASLKIPNWYKVWFVALYTGMRNGELYSLKWCDIDLDNNSITVCRSWNRKTRDFKTTKSGKYRIVPISPDLKTFLTFEKHNADSEFVLPRIKTWKSGAQSKVLRDFCKRIEIREIRMHDLRALFATRMLQKGISPSVVMKIGGWANLSTMERYIRQAGIEVFGATNSIDFSN